MRATTLLIITAFIAGVIIPTLVLKKCQNKQLMQVSMAKTDSGRYYHDIYGKEHLEKLQVIGNRNIIEAIYKQQIDSFAKTMGVKPKQVQGFQKASAELKDSVRVVTRIVHDSVGNVTGSSFNWADSFTTITGFVTIPDSTGAGKAVITYSSNLTLTSVNTWKRKHKFLGIRFGRKIYHTDITANNPKIHITGLENVEINK